MVISDVDWFSTRDEDRAFIAAANPKVVLALLDELDAARKVVEAAWKCKAVYEVVDYHDTAFDPVIEALEAYDRARMEGEG
jgi:hypothetical protein